MDSNIVNILIELSSVILLAASFAYLSYKIKQPIILGFVIVGFLLGPAVFHMITDPSIIVALSEIGIALLIYVVGAELDFNKLKAIKKNILLIGLVQVVITFVITFILTKLFGFNLLQSLFLGTILCISSTELIMKCLSDQKLATSLKGRILLGILLLQDVIIIIFLPILTTSTGSFSFMLVVNLVYKLAIIIVSALLVNFLVFKTTIRLASKNEEVVFLIILASCFGFILLATILDFSIIIATFIGGLILANYPYKLEIMDRIKEIKAFFSMFFFILLGMQITGFANIDITLLIIIAVVAILIKPISIYLTSLFFKYDDDTSFFVSTSLFQGNIFGLVLVQVATVQGIFNTSVSNTLILFIALTMILTPYVINYNREIKTVSNKIFFIDKISDLIRKIFRIKLDKKQIEKKYRLKDHIIIFGAGRMGTSIAEALIRGNIISLDKIVIVDNDPEPILDFINKGIYALCGHADNTEILDDISINKAKLIITTIPNMQVNKVIFSKTDPKKTDILVRAHFIEDAKEYYNLGAKYVVVPSILASNQIITEVCNVIEGKESNIFTDLYKDYLARKIRSQEDEQSKP